MNSVENILTNFHFVNEFWGLVAPCIMMAIDFLTGIIYAWSTKTFQSKKMRSGLSKKIGELAIIVIGEVLSFSLGLPKYIMTGISLYIIIMELMSVFENLDKMGVPVPKFIRDVINNVSDSIDNGKIVTDNISKYTQKSDSNDVTKSE